MRPETVSVIIPAFNEAATIEGVVTPAVTHPGVAEVIVVDDGSRDNTAERAKHAGASVIRLPKNKGKAAAMDAGVEATSSPYIFFVDGDVIGLSHETMSLLIEKVTSGEYDMYAALVARKRFAGWLTSIFPLLSGIRIMPRGIWHMVPSRHKKGFRIEIGLNYFASRMREGRPGRIGRIIVPELKHVIKEKKRGFSRGFLQRLRMIYDIAEGLVALYAGESLRRLLRVPQESAYLREQ